MPVLYLTIVGVVLTTGGASIIGWNDLMSEDKALDIGVTKAAGNTREENLTLPAVKELLDGARIRGEACFLSYLVPRF